MVKSAPRGEDITVGKGEIACYEQFFLFFFTVFSIDLQQTHKNQGLFGKGLMQLNRSICSSVCKKSDQRQKKTLDPGWHAKSDLGHYFLQLHEPFPKQQTHLDSSKLKVCRRHYKFDENGRKFSKLVENTLE